MVKKVHNAHIGIEGYSRGARGALYWPQVNAKIKDFVTSSTVCAMYPEQCQEPLHPHEVPKRPCMV